MKTPIPIRFARAPLIFATPRNVRLDPRMRSRPACAEAAASLKWNKGDRYRELRTAKSERPLCARVLTRPAAAARLRAAIAHRRECRLRGKDRRCVLLSAARLRSEWFFDQHDRDPPETHRLRAKEIPGPATEKILPSPSSRFFVRSVTK
jgi:hypothetical protein